MCLVCSRLRSPVTSPPPILQKEISDGLASIRGRESCAFMDAQPFFTSQKNRICNWGYMCRHSDSCTCEVGNQTTKAATQNVLSYPVPGEIMPCNAVSWYCTCPTKECTVSIHRLRGSGNERVLLVYSPIILRKSVARLEDLRSIGIYDRQLVMFNSH